MTASQRLRNLIKIDLETLDTLDNTPKFNRDDILGIMSYIFKDSRPVQLVGDVGIGKTEVIKRLIESDKQHIYIVFDVHDEYPLPAIQGIADNITQSSRIRMPEQISASKGLYPVYHNQILSHKHPEKYVVVIEEAHRYREIKELLKEARKFVKVIAICQEQLGEFCPMIKIVNGGN